MAAKDGKRRPELFGPYEVFERIGVGGMATVHRAKKQGIEGFERVVALKRMLSHLADDETFIKSFVREARLASQLQHANIIQIYDLGRVGRVYYIAMEYVRGRDLRKILKQTAYATGPMPLPMMLTLTRQLCDALDYAHNLNDENDEPLGLVHRDVSPSNILIAADGHLKIIDFGIAKATSSSLRTLSGRVKGKFAYMAPEAIQGKKLDRRTDIFAMGIVAYEMLTARPLFASKNQFDTIRKITRGEVEPPSTHNPECPPELDEIVLTALAKTPDERWQSAGAMHRALDHVAKKHGLQATNREIAEWVEWGFEQPLQSKRIDPNQRLERDDSAPIPLPPVASKSRSGKQPSLKSVGPVMPVDNVDSASIELVWGGRGSGRSKRPSAPVPGANTPSSRTGERAAAVPLLGDADSTPQVRPPQRASGVEGSARPSGEGAAQRGGPTGARGAATAQTSPAVPSEMAAVGSSQATMLGVAPPPGQTWPTPRLSREHSASHTPPTTGSGPTATTGASGNTRPTGRETSTGRSSGGARAPSRAPLPFGTGAQIALFMVLCVGAAVGGYFLVVAITGG